MKKYLLAFSLALALLAGCKSQKTVTAVTPPAFIDTTAVTDSLSIRDKKTGLDILVTVDHVPATDSLEALLLKSDNRTRYLVETITDKEELITALRGEVRSMATQVGNLVKENTRLRGRVYLPPQTIEVPVEKENKNALRSYVISFFLGMIVLGGACFVFVIRKLKLF